LADALATQAARLIVSALHQLPSLTPTAQDESRATHAPLLVKEDGFVRWQESAQAVLDRHRGVAAWPQTTAFVGGVRLKLAGLSVVADQSEETGQVIRADGDALIVACGAGAVRIQTLQPEARKPQAAAQWWQAQGQPPRFDLWEPQQP
jgi:methionyl-tRNA formyltransferase